MNFRFLLAHAAKDIAEIIGETRKLGAKAGWVCFKAHAENFDALLHERLRGSRVKTCPCCGWRGHRFRALFLADVVLHEAECPHCGAHQRQRALTLWFTRDGARHFKQGARWLHVAPEPSMRALLVTEFAAHIVSADLMPDKLRVVGGEAFRTDLTRAALATAAVDHILCVHVLEHIEDDGAAVHELHRVLGPSGLAIIMVPNDLGVRETHEYGFANPRVYGHWRDYTPYAIDAELAPFAVESLDPTQLFTPEDRTRHGLIDEDFIYLCRR